MRHRVASHRCAIGRQCLRNGGRSGSLIPHAGAIRALMIPMIEAAFGAPAVAVARRPNRATARDGATTQ